MKDIKEIIKENKEAVAEYKDKIDTIAIRISEIVDSNTNIEIHAGGHSDAEPDIEVEASLSGIGFAELKEYLKEVIKC